MRRTLQALVLALITLTASCGYSFAQTQDKWGDHTFQGAATFGGDTTSYIPTPAGAWLRIGRDSTTKGMLPARVPDTSSVTSPSFGLTVFSHADSCYYTYKDHWRKVGSNIADYIKATEKGVANGVATLDSNGLLEKAQVPAIAITNTYVVASLTDMLNLAADTGDICIRTDSSETFILQSTPATIYNNWKKLLSPGAPVTSVNGYTGVVTLGVDDIGGAVNLTGTQTISGIKTFTSNIIAPAGMLLKDASTGESAYLQDNSNNLEVLNDGNSHSYTFNSDGLTANRTYTMPDKDGTLATTGDVDALDLQAVTDQGNTTTDNMGVGTTSLQLWDNITFKALQIGAGGGVMSNNNTGESYLMSNIYWNGTNWKIAKSSSTYPDYISLVGGALTFFVAPKGNVGTIAIPVNVFSVNNLGNVTAGSFKIPGGTSSEALMADGSTAPLPTGSTPLVESVNHPLSNPSGTAANTDVQLQLDGSNYSYTIAAGTFASGDNMLIRIKFMYDFDITSGTTAQFKLDIGGTKYAVTPTVTGAKHGMGEVDITDVGTDTLHIVEVNDGAYLGDDLITALDASDAITVTPYYSQSVTSLGDECNIRPFTIEVMKTPNP